MEVFCRREIKYLLDSRQRAALEAEFAQRMQPDKFPHSSIRNIYYDTPDFRLIRRSLEHPIYKEKLRVRCYGAEAKTVFLEMKKKYKGIVYKRRLSLPEQNAYGFMEGIASLPDSQIGKELTYFRDFYQTLQPQVYLSYERDSWVGKEDPGLRITMDQQIAYRTTDLLLTADAPGQQILPPDTYLMEVKAEHAIPLWLVQLLAREKIHKVSFSKYGNAYLRLLEQSNQEKRGHHYVR